MKRSLSFLLSIIVMFCSLSGFTIIVYADYDANLAAHQKIDNILQNYVDPNYHLDKYALTESEESELLAVVEDVIADCSSEYEKISAVTRFVAENIYYDYDYYEGRVSETFGQPYEVWTNKRAVCAGYARLTKEFLNLINIPCMYVLADNHAYNVAYDSENDKWIYLDATWCSRNKYINEDFNTGSYNESRFDMSLETLSSLSNHEFYDLSGIVVDEIVYSIETPNTADEWSNTGEWYACVVGVADDFEASIVDIIDSFDGVFVKSIDSEVFYGCTSLISVTMPESLTTMGSSVFRGCTGLTAVTIPNSVTKMGGNTFYGCSNLESITLSDNLSSLGSFTFRGCSKLTSVTIPNSLSSISYGSFYNCKNLNSVKISNSVASIGNYAFSGCTSLTSITIPNSVTSIGNYAFQSCSSLTSITIPDSVTSIGTSAITSSTKIYCYENSTAHSFAVNNSRSYSLIKLYSVNEAINIDYTNNLIFSCADCCMDFSGFVSISEDFKLDMCESSTVGDTKLYGTGAKVNITNNGTFLDEYTVITVGDLNGDSVCDVLDASYAALVSSGKKTATQDEIYAANGEIADEIDILDYQSIVNKAVS